MEQTTKLEASSHMNGKYCLEYEQIFLYIGDFVGKYGIKTYKVICKNLYKRAKKSFKRIRKDKLLTGELYERLPAYKEWLKGLQPPEPIKELGIKIETEEQKEVIE